MNVSQRAQDILLTPKATWPQIATEPATVGSLFTTYLMVLALIPALCAFIGQSVLGVGWFALSLRVPLWAGLLGGLLGYTLSLAMVFVLARVVDGLAPLFGGTRNPVAALKLTAYASTAAFLTGFFNLVPTLGLIGLLLGLYGIYLLYLGLPVLMNCPPEKALGYTATVTLAGFLLVLALGSIHGWLRPAPFAFNPVEWSAHTRAETAASLAVPDAGPGLGQRGAL